MSESKSGGDRERVLKYLLTAEREGIAVGRTQLANALALTERTIGQRVSQLRKAGHDIEVVLSGPKNRVVTYTYKSAPGGPPAPAPDPRREPPAEEAAAPVPGTPTGAPPSAGEDVDAVGNETWSDASSVIVSGNIAHVFGPRPDPEVTAIGKCIAALEPLEQAARDRVITYLGQRYWT